MFLKKYLYRRKLKQKIRTLSQAERAQILESSPYEAVPFQGEGYHVFLKSVQDYHKGYVRTLGEISPEAAENWIIQQYLENKS